MKNKEIFVRFSNAESDIFEDLYNKLVIIVNFKSSNAMERIRTILNEEDEKSMLNSKDGFPEFKIKDGLAKGMDYFPFEPVEANFFIKFIQQHIDGCSTPSSFFSEHIEQKNSAIDLKFWERSMNLSQMETSTGTNN